LRCRTAGFCLTAAQPTLGAEMLEKREQSTSMIMVALGDWKCAGNRLAPAIIVQKTGIAADLT